MDQEGGEKLKPRFLFFFPSLFKSTSQLSTPRDGNSRLGAPPRTCPHKHLQGWRTTSRCPARGAPDNSTQLNPAPGWERRRAHANTFLQNQPSPTHTQTPLALPTPSLVFAELPADISFAFQGLVPTREPLRQHPQPHVPLAGSHLPRSPEEKARGRSSPPRRTRERRKALPAAGSPLANRMEIRLFSPSTGAILKERLSRFKYRDCFP